MTAAFTAKVKQTILDRSGGCCEICSLAAPVDAHHRLARGFGGSKDDRLGQPSNGLALCRACHDMAESDRKRAYDRGWMIHKGWLDRNGFTAADVPVVYHGDWAVLSDDGKVFRPPQGAGRCERCGFHVATQGHRPGCQVSA